MSDQAEVTPAVPAEGAGFYRLRDVPEGWVYRRSDNERWEYRDPTYWPDSGELVEARPKPKPKVAVMLTEEDVRLWVQYGVSLADMGRSDRLVEACREVLS